MATRTPEPAVPPIRLTELTTCGGCAAKLGADALAEALAGLGIEDGTSKGLVKFIGSKSKCYQKCNLNMLKGKIAPGSCDPPTPSDPATSACIFDPLKGAEAKGAAALDKVCSSVVGATPPCYGSGLDTGAEWIALVESAVDGNIPDIACGP